MTRVVSTILLCSFALAGLAGCKKEGSADPKAETDALRAAGDEMRAAYKAKDAARLIAVYAPDATLYIPSERPRVGTKALSEGMQAEMADPAFNVTFTTAKAHASGDLGYTQGSFTIRYTSPSTKAPISYSGYYLTVFKKQPDGSWKAVEDMSLPAS